MDVLQPDLLYIKGRCYRINPVNVNLNDDSQNKRSLEGYQNYYEADECRLDYDSEDEESKCPIEQVTGKGYRTAFHVARTYFPYIIGKKAATKKRLEMETKTQINVPKFGQEGDIVITGNNKSFVQAAYRRINLIIMTARRRQQYTHFISIPFCNDIIKTKFIEFKKEVLENCKDRGIEESVFQLPDKLHMTLCTMVLSDEVERNNAAQILQKCKTDVIDNILNGQTLKLRISGIEIMNDDPAEVNVLYGKIHCDDEDLLQLLSDGIVNYCVKAGIVEKEYDRVKLHITLMNTKFSPSNTDFGNRRNRNTINATNIMKMFENYDFGETTVESIHLSQMGAFSNSGYYKPSMTINITG